MIISFLTTVFSIALTQGLTDKTPDLGASLNQSVNIQQEFEYGLYLWKERALDEYSLLTNNVYTRKEYNTQKKYLLERFKKEYRSEYSREAFLILKKLQEEGVFTKEDIKLYKAFVLIAGGSISADLSATDEAPIEIAE